MFILFANHPGRRALERTKPEVHFEGASNRRAASIVDPGAASFLAIAASVDSWQYGLTDLHAPSSFAGACTTASSEAQPEYQDAEWQSKRQR